MKKYDKTVLFNLLISKIFYTVIVIFNLFLPIFKGTFIKISYINCIAIIVWTYGLLCHLGKNKKEISSIGNITTYEIRIPITWLFTTRLVQVIYYFIAKVSEINWICIFILIILDAMYLVFLIMDKSRFVLISESESEE